MILSYKVEFSDGKYWPPHTDQYGDTYEGLDWSGQWADTIEEAEKILEESKKIPARKLHRILEYVGDTFKRVVHATSIDAIKFLESYDETQEENNLQDKEGGR